MSGVSGSPDRAKVIILSIHIHNVSTQSGSSCKVCPEIPPPPTLFGMYVHLHTTCYDYANDK